MDTATTFEVRPGLASGRQHFRLEDTGLRVDEAGRSTCLAYDEVARVQLKVLDAERMGCLVVTRSGRSVLVPSHEYVSLGEFESRLEDFSAFVEALHERLRPFAAGIEFRRGAGLLYWVSLIGVVVSALLAVLVPVGVVMLDKPVDMELLSIVAAIPIMGFMCWTLSRVSRPASFTVDDLPQVLPGSPSRSRPRPDRYAVR